MHSVAQCADVFLSVAAVVQVVWMSVQLAGGATVREQSSHRRQEGSVEERTRYIPTNIL